jgi:hypothetical protein
VDKAMTMHNVACHFWKDVEAKREKAGEKVGEA